LSNINVGVVRQRSRHTRSYWLVRISILFRLLVALVHSDPRLFGHRLEEIFPLKANHHYWHFVVGHSNLSSILDIFIRNGSCLLAFLITWTIFFSFNFENQEHFKLYFIYKLINKKLVCHFDEITQIFQFNANI
jgi:hypothetical protein